MLRKTLKLRIGLFELALFASLAPGAVHAEEFISPNRQVKIDVNCDSNGSNCEVSYRAGRKVGKLDVDGNNVGVSWFGNTAAVTSSCGTACNGTDFVDGNGVVGSYSDVLSFDESTKCVAFMKDWNVIQFEVNDIKIRDVNINTFRPRPMKTASFATLAEAPKFERGDFSVSYLDENEKSHRVTIKDACADGRK